MTSEQQLRRRGETLRRAVLAATVEEIAASGPTTSIQAVARRAGVHETSVYRRWKTRENLLLDALVTQVGIDIPPPDTGSAREDLIAIIRGVLEFTRSPMGVALLQAATQAPPEYDLVLGAFWDSRAKHLTRVIERAKGRGELPPDLDGDLLLEVLVAPLHFRRLLSRREIEPDLPERLTDLILHGARTPWPVVSQPD